MGQTSVWLSEFSILRGAHQLVALPLLGAHAEAAKVGRQFGPRRRGVLARGAERRRHVRWKEPVAAVVVAFLEERADHLGGVSKAEAAHLARLLRLHGDTLARVA